MDDNQLDQFFKQNLGEPEHIPFDERGWAKIADRIPPTNPKGSISAKTWLVAALSLLLLSNAIWAYFFFRQGDQIGQTTSATSIPDTAISASIPDAISLIANRVDTVFRVDTIYLIPQAYLKGTTAFVQEKSGKSQKNTLQNFTPTTSQAEKLPIVALIINSDSTIVNNEQIAKNSDDGLSVMQDSTNQLLSFDETFGENADQEKSKLDSMTAILQDDRLSDEELSEQITQIERNIKKEKSAASFLKRVRLGVGGSLAGWTDVPAPAEKGHFAEAMGGIMVETKLNDRMRLITGVMTGKSNYKLDYFEIIPTEDELNAYPQLLNPEPPGNLHEIYMNSSVYTVPIWAKYYLTSSQDVRPYLTGGLNLRIIREQEFIYEYLKMGQVNYRTPKLKETNWNFSTVQAAFGMDLHINKLLRGDLALFIKGDLGGQGVEKQKTILVGLSGGLWLGKH